MQERFGKILKAVDEITAGMTEEQMSYRPEGKWSTCDVLEHLALTYGGTAKGFRKRILEGPEGGTPTAKQRVGQLLVLELNVFPFKRKSPAMVAPKANLCGQDALALLKRNLAEMEVALYEYSAKHGAKGKAAKHPVLGPLTLEQWGKFHLNHAMHHMKQIQGLRAAQTR
jgi:hypothetical protein